ncbi:MAG: type IIA DNA topoisomerase subunit B [Kiritimatiellaeota bacterium]|nr:type IIA DNA topoisomerase subunit B [Kiritimatiellota bacterium]
MPPEAIYDESKIKTLSSLEHIRLRPGMYIGRMGDGSHPDDGIYILLKEIIDNAVDEYIMGHGRRIDIVVEGKKISVRDYGRGIPLGKLIECVSQINTGAKYNTDVFHFSVGLNGVGTKAVNALSQEFLVESYREGKAKRAYFEHGKLISDSKGATDEKNGTFVSFVPDREMFPEYDFQMDYIEKRLWMYAFLNSGLSLYFNGQRYYSKNGLRDLIDAEVDEDRIYNIIHYKDKTLEFAFSHTSNYGETYFSFVNGQHTNDGGTHLSAFREGVLKAVNEFSGKSYTGNDVRDGVVGAISIKLQDPIFESQTKNKLGNSDIRGWIVGIVKQAIVDYLHRHLEESELLLGKVALNEKVRKEIQAVKKQSREKAKKMNLKIPKLKDCKHHFGDSSKYSDDTMVFLTEGQSAAGAMVSCRNVMTQAIFSLKGKPLNCFGEKIDKVYQNEELYFIMQTLNIEDELEGLRYNMVVIATDSDVDGLHIRNLLITFFLTFYEPLVLSGHLYILETPLFRVRNKKETIYCYSESERDEAVAKLGGHAKGVEVTRFKGLGEISPNEFGQFIGDDIKLVTVTVDNMRNIPEMLNFYMGKNTPYRKEHIMNNLV